MDNPVDHVWDDAMPYQLIPQMREETNDALYQSRDKTRNGTSCRHKYSFDHIPPTREYIDDAIPNAPPGS